MHSKAKGNIGELVVLRDLAERGYSVFIEFGDLSKVDIIVIVDDEPVKVQVKTFWQSASGSISIGSRNCGPGYTYHYKESDVDIFAIYVHDRNELMYLNSSVICGEKKSITLRFTQSKKNFKKVKYAKDFKKFPPSLT